MIAPSSSNTFFFSFLIATYLSTNARDTYPRGVYTSKQCENNGNDARNEVVEIMAELNTKMPRSTRNDAQRLAGRQINLADAEILQNL